MRLGVIAFLAGLLGFHHLADLPERWWGCSLLGLLWVIWRFPLLRLPAWYLAGFCWGLLCISPAQNDLLPAELESVDLRVTGWVVSLPEISHRRVRFRFQVDVLRRNARPVPFSGKLRLSWYAPHPRLRVGEPWALTVRLKRPRGLANPGGFDYEGWLFSQGITAQGYVRAYPVPRRLARGVRYPLQRFRQAVAERFAQHLPDSPYRGVLTALAVGNRDTIPSWQWQVFTRTGTGHLLAISGLHIGLVAGLVFGFVRYSWAWVPWLVYRWPAGKAAALGALLGAGGYTLLAGMSLPTQRAFLMVAVAMLALLSQRPIVPSRLLALALWAVLLTDPMAPLAGGFWLSFGAVAALVYGLSGRGQVERTLGQWLRLQWIVSLALLPATLMLFQQFSLLAPLANLIAIPWVSVTVVPLTLLAVLVGLLNPSAQAGLLKIAELTMDWLWGYLAWLSNLSWASLPWPAPPLWSLGFALPGLILLLAPRGLPGRWLGGILCLPLLYFPKAAPAPGEVWFSLLDVGPGLAAVVRTATHTLVYDTGPRWSAGFDAGRSAVLPSLRQQGVTSVDTLILSHADNAHVGGTRTLLEQLEVAQVLTSSLVAVPVAGAQPCREGQEWRWDGVRFRLLHPPVVGKFSGDNASCVLLVEGKAGSILLPGDSGSAAQAALVERYGDALAAQVLVAPHHGTRKEALPSFLTHVNPRYVLFSSGSDNRYPTADTRLYYRQTGATVLDTAQHGCISFRITARQALIPELYRQQVRRYWHIP